MLTVILAVITVFLVSVSFAMVDGGKYISAAIAFVLAIVSGYFYFNQFQLTDEEKVLIEKQKVAIAAANEEMKIPKKFSATDDGCTVYKFVDDGYNHYFARCDKMVAPDSPYRSGKSTKHEVIDTVQ